MPLFINAVSAALTGNSRETDLVARLGGDEFAVLLPESSLSEAETHSEKLLQAIGAVVVEGVGQGITVAASCGVAGEVVNG